MGYNRILPRVGGGGSFQDKANQFSGNAINARSRMGQGSRTETTGPGKTVGGGIMAALGGAGGGAGIAMGLGLASNPAGWVVGGAAALSTLAYYLG